MSHLIQRSRFLLLVFLLVLPQFVRATDIIVTTNSDAVGVNGSLRQALQFNAFLGGGNNILFTNTVTGTILLAQGELLIDHDVTIVGPGAKALAINGNHASLVIHITGNINVNLSGLTVTNGNSVTGAGGILAGGGTANLTMINCAVSGNSNSGGVGGGITKESGNTTLINCLISGNSASTDGGGIEGKGFLMTNCTVTGNSAGAGGGIYVTGNMRLVHCTISGNQGGSAINSGGGGIYVATGTVTIGNTIIAGNTCPAAAPDAYGVYISAGYNLIGNTSQAAGFGTIGDQLNVNPLLGPLQDNGGPTLTRALLPGSPAIDQGSASGTTTDQRGRARPFVNNPSGTLPFGGDFSDVGAYELSPINFVVTNTNDHGLGSLRQTILDASGADGITFASNVAGTIALTNGELVVNKQLSILGPANNRVVVSGNNTSRVFRVTAPGNLNLAGLTIANGNSVGQGGGAFNESGCTLTFSNCAVTANISGDNGGGVANNGTFAAYNCTFTGNRANFTGGAIYTYAGPVLLRNCTIVSNSTVVAEGGGLCNYSPIFGTSNNIGSTIVAGNSAPPGHSDVLGVFTSAGYNLIGKIDYTTPSSGVGTGVLTRGLTNGVNHDQVGSVAVPINPLIGVLQDNGGPTPTVTLLPGSPAINTGTNNGLLVDQRGAPRTDPSSGLSDVGAFELNLPPVVTNTRDSGIGSLRETINDFVLGDTITFASNIVGTIVLTNGELVVGKSVSILGLAGSHLVISGNNTSRVFRVTGGSSVNLSGLTIANGNSGQGAGAFNDFGCALTLSNCTVVANNTTDNGGGIANNGTFAAYNSTFTDNHAFYTGGAIYTYAGPVLLRNCTVVSNSSLTADGGGLCNYSFAPGTSNNLSGTIVAWNNAPAHKDVLGDFTSGGYNLIGQIDYSASTNGVSTFLWASGLTNGVRHDQVGSTASPINPLLGVLRDNGGPTLTMALFPGSPAIDAGTNNGLATDQRGAPRPFDFATIADAVGSDASDIGAFELGTPQLALQPVVDTMVLTWPSYYGGFTLQSATNLLGANNWQPVLIAASVIGNQYYVTNVAADGNKFYRLSSP